MRELLEQEERNWRRARPAERCCGLLVYLGALVVLVGVIGLWLVVGRGESEHGPVTCLLLLVLMALLFAAANPFRRTRSSR